MARENQGLQITLIVFVVLTILLGAFCFVFFSQSKDLTAKLTEAQKDAEHAKGAVGSLEDDLKKLKQYIGFTENDDVQTIQETFKKDMAAYASSFPADTQYYHQVVGAMYKSMESAYAQRDEERKTTKMQKAQLAAVDMNVTKQIDPLKAKIQTVETESADAVARANAARDLLKTDKRNLEESLKNQKTAHTTEVTELQGKATALAQELKKKADDYGVVRQKLEDITRPNPDRFQGAVDYVSQHDRTVYINLGWADGLRPQVNFSVYPAEENQVTELARKAKIEVTEVIGAHRAKARIISDRPTDPILPQDRLFTAIWSPNEPRHFALTGSFDLNNDGQSDLDRIHTLIELNGGVVDAPRDAEGKRHGKLSIDTRFLIVGKEPDASSPPDALKDHTDMITQANDHKIEKIKLSDFLDMVGWKPEVEVSQYDATGNANLPMQPHEHVQQPGNPISEIFKPRKPPRSSGGSAF
ncbi:MAG: hypothetical protein JW818_14560 [Pirellulales bacterium]|nr:hypothetical protein [Pirellulales bacterium]